MCLLTNRLYGITSFKSEVFCVMGKKAKVPTRQDYVITV